MNLLSVIIPARNEEKQIQATITHIKDEMSARKIDFEIIVINDGSTDRTEEILANLNRSDSRIRCVNNPAPHGIGYAIRKGFEKFKGDYVIIAMADGSDDPKDMVSYYEMVKGGYDCCFGQRWKAAQVQNYPKFKFIINRLVNWGISILFGLHYTDVTNAFKCYSRKTIEGVYPILSPHFNITVELPLKAIVRGYSYTVIPTNWYNRKQKGESSLILNEMGTRYLFIVLYVLIEKWFTGKDYKRKN